MRNALWLCCIHHPDRTQAIQLGRRVADGYHRAPTAAKLEEFFEKHELCGGGFDHFTIAYDLTKDHDLPTPNRVADVVHLKLQEAKRDARGLPIRLGSHETATATAEAKRLMREAGLPVPAAPFPFDAANEPEAS